jgi:hypothetical protein
MSNTTIGPGTKKETVYSGPTPQTKQGTVYNGPAPAAAGGTVYEGPAMKTGGGGMVYGGPASGSTGYGGQAAGTVYTPPRPAASQQPGAPTHDPAARKGGTIFFAIAIFTAINTALIAAGSSIVLGLGSTTSKVAVQGQVNAIVMINIMVIGVFVLLGIFARQGSKAAFIIGMLLYGGDAVLLLASGDPSTHIGGIVVHVVLLVGLFKSFAQLGG